MNVIFTKVEPGTDPKEVAWHNMAQADRHLNLKLLCLSMVGYFNSYENKNYQDLEVEFRARKFNTHIIARQPIIPIHNNDKYGLSIKNDGKIDEDLSLQAIFSVRPPPFALDELKCDWKTYEENFKALKFAGIMVSRQSTNDLAQDFEQSAPTQTLKLFEMSEIHLLNQLCTNELMFYIVRKIPKSAKGKSTSDVPVEIKQEKSVSDDAPVEVKQETLEMDLNAFMRATNGFYV